MPTLTETEQFVIAKVEAQRTSTLIQVGAILAAAACIALAAALQSPINTKRTDLQLVMNSEIYKELPPEYAWVSAVGGAFRGIAADILWMRADKLKEEGKYYEAHQLAKWICTLYPRFPAVWAFQAWNMSYNISVATHTAQERWQWVYNGIRLLRDEGIPNNERVVPLYHQLAWTWFHKVGDRMDDFHWVYKRLWAARMETLLGPPPQGATNAEQIAWFRPVAEAPRSLEELLAAHPGVKDLVERLEGLGVDVNVGTKNEYLFHPLEDKFFRPYTAYNIRTQLAALRSQQPEASEQEQKLFEFFASAAGENLDALLAFLRAKVLREQYKMDPEYMLDMTGRLGTSEPLPIDWRTPWSQALYWGMYGTDKGGELKTVKEFDILSTDRIVLFSLMHLFKAGRFVFRINQDDPKDSFLNPLPDLRYVEALHNKYIELGKKHAEEGEDVGETASEALRSGHVNTLHEAIVTLYLSGQEAEARKYLEYLAINYRGLYDKKVQEQYLQSLDAFAQAQLKDMVDSYASANHLIHSVLTSGYLALAAGSADQFVASIQRAKLIYDIYQKDKIEDVQGRRAMPPFERVRADALGNFIVDPSRPVPVRSMVWKREQAEIRQQTYDLVIPYLARQCEEEGYDVTKAFPAPPGMEEYRKANPQPEQAEDVAKRLQEEKRKEQKD